MAHMVLKAGDLAQMDASFCGWLPVKILEPVREREFGQDHYTVRVRVQVTIRKPRHGFKPGEIVTANASDVLPRKGWRQGSSVFRTYHAPGFCHRWAACEGCGRMSSQVPPRRVEPFRN